MTQKQSFLWHTFFVISCLIYVYIRNLSNLPLEWIPKIVPILLLLAWVQFALEHTLRRLASVALCLSLCGDVLLSLNDLFIPGLGAFLLAQLTYAVLFIKLANINKKGIFWCASILTYSLTAAYVILPKTHGLILPVAIYLAAISVMAISAGFIRGGYSIMIMLGAFTFMVSDTLIAINKFLIPFEYAGIAIMVSYYFAQYLIIMGLTRWASENPITIKATA